MSDRKMDDQTDIRLNYNGCSDLKFTTVLINKPAMITTDFWMQATATGELCGHGNCGSIAVSASGLIPAGIYTLWFLTDKGPYPAAPTDADFSDGSCNCDPNRLLVNSAGILNYYIAPLNFNPFKGIPLETGGVAKIQNVAIAYHSDRVTHGSSPGTLDENVFYQLIAPIGCAK